MTIMMIVEVVIMIMTMQMM